MTDETIDSTGFRHEALGEASHKHIQFLKAYTILCKKYGLHLHSSDSIFLEEKNFDDGIILSCDPNFHSINEGESEENDDKGIYFRIEKDSSRVNIRLRDGSLLLVGELKK